MSGEAPTANETIATIMAANALAPRPRPKVVPVKGLDAKLPTRLLLRIDESRSYLGRPFGG